MGLAQGIILTGISPGRDALLVEIFLRPWRPAPIWLTLSPPTLRPTPRSPPLPWWWWRKSEIILVEFDFFIIQREDFEGERDGGSLYGWLDIAFTASGPRLFWGERDRESLVSGENGLPYLFARKETCIQERKDSKEKSDTVMYTIRSGGRGQLLKWAEF